jgi:hypothetical protein
MLDFIIAGLLVYLALGVPLLGWADTTIGSRALAYLAWPFYGPAVWALSGFIAASEAECGD